LGGHEQGIVQIKDWDFDLHEPSLRPEIQAVPWHLVI
jgi:hypothetical protein